MTAQILDGKGLAQKIRAEIKDDVEKFIKETNVQPALAVVLVGENEASKVYVRNKEKACNEAGIKSLMYRLPTETSSEELLKLVRSLNDDVSVHGILVQLPLPEGIVSSRKRRPRLSRTAAFPAVHALRNPAIAGSVQNRNQRQTRRRNRTKRYRR